MEMPPDTLEAVGINELADIVDRLKCATNLLAFLRTHEISQMSHPFLTLSSIV